MNLSSHPRQPQYVPISSQSPFLTRDNPQHTVAFIDPSANPQNPGWPLRNLLAYLRALYPSKTSSIRVLCWRDSELPSSEWKSRFGVVHVSGDPIEGRPTAVGWEKNTQGKLGPRVADLAPMMDPTRFLTSPSSDDNVLTHPLQIGCSSRRPEP